MFVVVNVKLTLLRVQKMSCYGDTVAEQWQQHQCQASHQTSGKPKHQITFGMKISHQPPVPCWHLGERWAIHFWKMNQTKGTVRNVKSRGVQLPFSTKESLIALSSIYTIKLLKQNAKLVENEIFMLQKWNIHVVRLHEKDQNYTSKPDQNLN